MEANNLKTRCRTFLEIMKLAVHIQRTKKVSLSTAFELAKKDHEVFAESERIMNRVNDGTLVLEPGYDGDGRIIEVSVVPATFLAPWHKAKSPEEIWDQLRRPTDVSGT